MSDVLWHFGQIWPTDDLSLLTSSPAYHLQSDIIIILVEIYIQPDHITARPQNTRQN